MRQRVRELQYIAVLHIIRLLAAETRALDLVLQARVLIETIHALVSPPLTRARGSLVCLAHILENSGLKK
jgi:hypothetical protein